MIVQKRFFKTKDEVEVLFEAPADTCATAEFVCETTGWTPVPMSRSNRGRGPFRVRMRLPKNAEIQFRYLIDGRWENDQGADAYRPNGFGSDNSVVFTGDPGAG